LSTNTTKTIKVTRIENEMPKCVFCISYYIKNNI
jgi:hypothetical protein